MKFKKIILILILVLGIIDISLFVFFGIAHIKEEDRGEEDATSSLMNVNESVPLYLKTIPDIKSDLIFKKEAFVEINLSDMMVRIFNNGQTTHEYQILAKGDLFSWGGTAAGLHKVIYKSKVAWSGAADVYMPYAVNFYGKYFVHGEPYYPGGEKLISDYSGGCIRLSDKDIKEFYSLVKAKMPVLVIDKNKDSYDYGSKTLTELPDISATSYLVADIDNGFVLAQKNPEERLPIASLTKLMTSMVISENVNLEKYITVTEKMLQDGYGPTTNLFAGQSYRITELFYPLLIESSNDAAYALASYLGQNNTIMKMNSKAKAILMENTTFTDVSGYDPNNVSDVKDLFQLVRYINNVRPLIFKITKGEKVKSFGFNRFFDTEFWNKNIFYLDDSLIGGKTGFIKQSKETGTFLFRFLDKDNNTRNVVIMVLGTDDVKRDVQRLYGWVNKNYFSPF